MRSIRRRLAATAAVLAAIITLPLSSATAATGDRADRPAVPRAAEAGDARGALAWKRLDLTMQAQLKTNWCWAAGGNTIAAYYGKNYSQNQFCNAAFNRQQGTECPNNQATLGNVQTGLRWAGVGSGSYINNWLRYPAVQTEIDANRPIETRIQWSSGGGHMHVIYGYDTANSWVYWGDPWQTSDRYNWASHAWYVNNSSFSWTHSLYRIGA
ncbi:papain-like cysteine protease family protein [Streptomyces sp. NPDC014894]|uniref:papain-like cysteine protease family protein n=1 Tax=unclassified Streptomyces TaxID=2593676 RepID=UPI0037016D0C